MSWILKYSFVFFCFCQTIINQVVNGETEENRELLLSEGGIEKVHSRTSLI
jgi:hypothetical protein